MKSWIVPASFHQKRLMDFLFFSLHSKVSKRKLKNTLEKGCCRLNGRIERFASKRVLAKDKVEYLLLEEETDQKIHLLFEDEHIFVLNKPIGISCEKKVLSPLFNQNIFLVHRLDKTTSGILILAKTKTMFDELKKQFQKQQVKKKYLAIVDRKFQKEKDEYTSYLIRKKFFQGQTIWGSNYEQKGRFAKTKVESIEMGEDFSLLECFPLTGKTHQIRVHLAEAGHPILGDFQYCRKFQCKNQINRVMLHCYAMEFYYPPLQERLLLKTPFPEDFENFFEKDK